MVFKVRVIPDGDGFHAKVLGLPGCGTWGRTKEEALINIREAIEVYFAPEEDEEVEIPEAASLLEVKAASQSKVSRVSLTSPGPSSEPCRTNQSSSEPNRFHFPPQ